MTEKKDIKDVMGEFMPEAPANGWEAVSAKLAESGMQDIRENIADFRASVRGNHWKLINRRLVMDRFMTFHAKRFNILYLFLLLLMVSGAVILATPWDEPDALYSPSTQVSTLTDKDLYQPTENINNTAGTPASGLPSHNADISDNALAGQSDIPVGGMPAGHFGTAAPSAPDTVSQYDADAYILDEEPPVYADAEQSGFRAFIKRMPLLRARALKTDKAGYEISKFSPLPDTLGIDAFGEPIIQEEPHFALSLGVAGNYPVNTYEFSDNSELLVQNQSLTSFFNSHESPQFSYGIDLNLDYIENHTILSTGIGFQETRHFFNSVVPTTFVDSVPAWQNFTNHGWDYDTTYYINIDTLAITGDTVYTPYLDSTWVAFQDSVQVMSYDSTAGNKLINKTSIVRYIDIPLWIGYREKLNKWEIQAQLGLITSIPVYQQMTWYNVESNEFVYNQNAPLNNVIFTGAFRTYVARRLNDNWLIGIEPSYYYRLNPLFDKNYPLDTKQHLFRLGVRVQYQF